jgi:diacylglycerol kinase (ATP)
LSTGFDSVVNERANNFKAIRGSIKYVIAVLLEVWKFKAVNFTLRIDGQEITQEAMLICIANGNSYGAGMKIVPHARHDDGLLDVMVVDRVNPLRLLLVFPRVFFGTHSKHPKVHFYSGKEIEILGATNAYADGERISQLPIKISISEKVLQVYKL